MTDKVPLTLRGKIELEEEEEFGDSIINYSSLPSSSSSSTSSFLFTVHELFEEQVKKTPDSIAVVFEDEQISYRELNRRSNQLANYLSQLGVGPEKLVAISLERSVEMIVSIISVLKTGAAYVPIDINYSEQRKSFILQDALFTP